jgi:diguanylate cyclase (GGDEF)-like protein
VVAFAGEDLQINSHVLFGWKPTGPTMKLDSVKGFNILTIDGRPAFEVYRKYLNIEPGVDKDFFLLEFPLLVERNGCVLARNPISASQNGSVTLLADVYSGETVQLGYLDVDLVIHKIQEVMKALSEFVPEAIFIYSCICRRFTLQQDTEMEISPFQLLAPVSGFFTYGEFCRYKGRLQLLNSSQVVVSMREGESAQATQQNQLYARSNSDHFRLRHMRVTSRLIHLIGTLTEELKSANMALQYQAEHDFLTKTYNRTVMNKCMEKEVARSIRHKHSFSVIMIDIDHFKHFNDVYGHAAGDHVLQEFTRLISKLMRMDDSLFRYGGEEFLLLLPETGVGGAMVVAEKCRKMVASLAMEHDGHRLSNITASFGVASFPGNGDHAMAVIKAADQALYESKNNGRNRVTVIDH